MKIAIAEDDPITLQLLQKVLITWGHEVFTAENGVVALELILKHKIKLVIADWIMPEMDGLALCRKIRSMTGMGYIYFILLTGKDAKEDIVAGLENGADDYVTKPFVLEELRVRLRAGARILEKEQELNVKNEELLELNAKLETMACIDPLMEIGNRRSLYRNIEKMHDRLSRYGEQYCLILADIDHFKAYNDLYGHLAGDQILKQVAECMVKSLRVSDEIYRYGGEEVVILLPNQDVDGGRAAADRVRRGIEILAIGHKGAKQGILTASFGATIAGLADRINRWEDVLERADKALYQAKKGGRNLVTFL